METEIRFSGIYNKTLNSRFSEMESKKLIKKILKFEKYYKDKEKRILKLIEKYSGYRWKREYIPVYIVDFKGKSFSDPLTLKFRENKEIMLIVLIHELVHNNIPHKIQNKFKDRRERLVNLVTKYVALDLKLNIKNTHIKFELTDKLKMNLNKKPLSKFLEMLRK